MAYPTAPGQPTYSGVFIPEIWSTKMIEKYYDNTVLTVISNTDYEGEISSQGDKVVIRTHPTLEINDYEVGQTLTNQRPVGDKIELLIDKGLYWSAIIDDVVEKQQDIDQMNSWANDASEQMKIKLDTRVLASMPGSAHADNTGNAAGRISGAINLGSAGTPVALEREFTSDANEAGLVQYILDHGQALDEQNVPETGRWIILPFWATTLLKGSELKDASLSGDGTSTLRNGRVGQIDRFTVYNSNLLPTNGTQWNILSGTDAALTFATQLTKTESIRAESTFGDIMRGLMVYGHKVVKPEALCVGTVTQQ